MRFDNELERALHDWMEATAAEPSPTVLAAALERVERTPQRRHRWLGRWQGRGGSATRGAGAHGDPSDTDIGRNRLMFTLTSVAASVAALALVATLAVPRAGPGDELAPGAEGSATHIVATDGSGQFGTIGEAVAVAAEGDTILVRPGEYAEALVIDKDLTLQGEGAREDIVITFKKGAPPQDLDGALIYFPIVLRGTDSILDGLSVRAPADGGAIHVNGGSPTLQDLQLTVDPGGYLSIAMGGQSRPVVRESTLGGIAVTDDDGTSPTFEEDEFVVDGLSADGPGETIVRDSTFSGGSTLSVSGGMTARVEGNHFSGGGSGNATDTAITAESESDIVVRDNTFDDLDMGVNVWAYSTATIEGNEFVDSGMAIVWGSTRGGVIDGNTIRRGFSGITIDGGSPSVTGNTIEDVTGRGIAIGVRAEAVVEQNHVCGCGTNLYVAEGSGSQMGENDVCDEVTG